MRVRRVRKIYNISYHDQAGGHHHARWDLLLGCFNVANTPDILIKQTNVILQQGCVITYQTLLQHLNKDSYPPGLLFGLYFLCGSSLGSIEGTDCSKTIRGKYITYVKNRRQEMNWLIAIFISLRNISNIIRKLAK